MRPPATLTLSSQAVARARLLAFSQLSPRLPKGAAPWPSLF